MVNEKEVKTIQADDWFYEYDKPRENTEGQLPIFEMKLKDGQLSRKEKLIFLTEGEKKSTPFGEAITFKINHDKIDKVWFIKKTQFALLNPIAKQKKKGDIAGLSAEVERVGSGAKDTKWSLVFK